MPPTRPTKAWHVAVATEKENAQELSGVQTLLQSHVRGLFGEAARGAGGTVGDSGPRFDCDQRAVERDAGVGEGHRERVSEPSSRVNRDDRRRPPTREIVEGVGSPITHESA